MTSTIRQTTLSLPKTSDAAGNLYFLRFRVKRPGVQKAERRFMALHCLHSTFDEEVEFFLDLCRRQWPGGHVRCRGMFHGPLRYVAPDGTEVLFCGLVASPVNGMEEGGVG